MYQFAMNHATSRREAVKSIALVAAAAATCRARSEETSPMKLKGHIRHSACRWCYGRIPLEELAREGKAIGLEAIDLLSPGEWPAVKAQGLICSLASSPNVDGLGGIARAFNRVEHHDKLVPAYEDLIARAAEAGVPSVICFSGNRDGLDDEAGVRNCVAGIKRIMPAAEKHGINVFMELLNSKVNHRDYQCDHTAWGVQVVKGVGSERFKLLYDIYHMQIMEGDVIATIREHAACIGHYHTGGVPGRNEIDETQELYYPAICRAIVATGFKGFLAQEFVPARDPLASLRQGVGICDI